MNIKKIIVRDSLFVIMSLFIISFCATNIFAETVQLKDGTTLKGRIINEDKEAIWLEVPFANGKLVRKILKSNITPLEDKIPEKPAPPEEAPVPGQPKQQNTASVRKTAAATERYFSLDKSFSIEFPGEWKRKRNDEFGMIFVLEPGENPYGKYRMVVGVSIYQPPKAGTLEKCFQVELKSMASLASFKGEEGNGDIDINGVKAKWVIYKYLSNDKSVSKQLLYVLLSNGKEYLIACTASEDVSYSDKFDPIVQSMRFGDKTSEKISLPKQKE